MKNKRGTSLILVMIVVVVAGGVVAAGFNYAISKDKTISSFQKMIQLKYAADSALEEVKAKTRYSIYLAGRNQYLYTNGSSTGTTVFTKAFGDSTIKATIFSLGNYWYRIEAEAAGINNFKYKVALQVKERDNFSRYVFFVDLDDLNIGTTTVRGQVHTNKRLKNYFGGARYYENVEAANQGTGSCPSSCTCNYGFAYCNGATPSNTYFYKDANPQGSVINMPTTSDIATLHTQAYDCYRVSNASPCWSAYGNFNTEIEFINGNQVKITAKHLTTGATLKTVTLPLPSNNLIFVQNRVTSLKGNLNGRVTIAVQDATRCSSGSPDTCNAAVNFTGNVEYIDQDGDKAYQLYDSQGRVVTDTGMGVVWQEPNYQYKPNPNYNPSIPSNLTVMAVGDIMVKCTGTPYNFRLNSVNFSAQGNWHMSLACPSNSKGNLRYVGSMITKYAGWRYSCYPPCSTYRGWGLSGEYIYDENLQSYPPDWIFPVDRPLFVSYRKIY